MNPVSRRGRPRLSDDERLERANVRLNPDLYDRACKLAARHGMTLSAFLRLAISASIKSSKSLSASE